MTKAHAIVHVGPSATPYCLVRRQSLRVLNRTQRDPFRKSVVWQRSGLLRLVAARAGSVAASSFFLRPPAIGRSNERWPRSAVGLARFCLAVLPRLPASPVRDCVSAPPSKSITGGGVMTSQTDRGANRRPKS